MPIGPEQNSSRFFIENVSTPPLPLDTQFTYPMVQFVTLVNLAMWLSYRNVLRFSPSNIQDDNPSGKYGEIT